MLQNDTLVKEKIVVDTISKKENVIIWLLNSYYQATGLKVIFINRKGEIISPLSSSEPL